MIKSIKQEDRYNRKQAWPFDLPRWRQCNQDGNLVAIADFGCSFDLGALTCAISHGLNN